MKLKNNFFVFCICFLLFAGDVSAYNYATGACPDAPEGAAIAARKIFSGAGSGDCLADATALMNDTASQYPVIPAVECARCVDWDPNNCVVFMFNYYCANEVLASKLNIENTTAESAVISGVTAGGERDAAEAWFATFDSANSYPPATGDRVRTDGAKGFSYITTMAAGGGTTIVNVVGWKRGIYTNPGANPIPLGDLGGTGGSGSGSGSGGLTVEETAGAVAQGVAGVQTSLEGIDTTLTGIDSTADGLLASSQGIGTSVDGIESSVGVIGTVVNTISGLASDAVGVLQNVKTSIDDFLTGQGSNTVLTPESMPDADVSESDKNDFSAALEASFDAFKVDMQNTGLYNLAAGYFNGVPANTGSEPIVIHGGVFGDHTFDFEVLAPSLAILKAIILVCFGFLSVRIVTKGGGG